MEEVRIRKARKSDAKATYFLQDPKSRYFTVEDLKISVNHKDAVYLVAEKGGEVIGYIIGFLCPTKRAESMLVETQVKESERHRGLGTMLVEAYCNEAAVKGAKCVVAEVLKKDIEFYGKCNFKVGIPQWVEIVRKL